MNILLLDKDFNYCKTLLNSMSALNKEIRISYIATSLQELTHFYDVDVILADFEFYDSGIEMLFENCQFIYLSENSDNDLTISKNNIDSIIRHIERKSHDLSESYIESLMYSELVALGYEPSLLGSKCILEALKIMYYADKSALNIKLAIDVYPKIAEKLGISVGVVKGNMNYATTKMLEHANKEYLMQYFDYELEGKASIKSILHQIIKKIRSTT